MQHKNQNITFSQDEIVQILKELECLVVSFDHLISWYGVTESTEFNEREFEKELTNFVCNSRVPERLSFLRYLIESKVNTESGEDGMDNIEKALTETDIKYWIKPGDHVDKIDEYHDFDKM